MEDKFYKDEFEQFLQQQANNHRMYPTDGVWQGIYKKLHGDKKWPALTIAAFTFLVATIAISLYFTPKPNIFALSPTKISAPPAENKSSNGFNNPLISAVSNIAKDTKGKDYISQQNNLSSFENPLPAQAVPIDLTTIPVEKRLPVEANTLARSFEQKPLSVHLSAAAERISSVSTSDQKNNNIPVFQTNPSLADNNSAGDKILNKPTVSTPNINTPGTNADKDRDDKNIADEFLKQHSNDVALFTTTRKVSQKNKFSYTVYIAPSISYRKLKEDQILNHTDNLNGPVALNYVTDVNKVVRHKPGTGVEAGIGFTYNLTNALGIQAGFQFNIRQYNIEAFKTPFEVAPIALLRSNGVDTINTFAVYRNNNGNLSTELVNRYYQVSIPVGIVWEVIGSNKVKLNVAANIQPTYIINRNSFLLSTNFKNYTENSGMLRNWNINSNIEAFMSIKMGEYKWQLGPQLRYQHLPTFMTQYPIREHLMDYGFKIGVSKLIK